MIDYVNGSIIKSGSSNGKYIGHKITDIADTHTIGFDNTPLRTIYVDITREDVDGKYTRTFRFNFTDKNGKWSYIGAQSN